MRASRNLEVDVAFELSQQQKAMRNYHFITGPTATIMDTAFNIYRCHLLQRVGVMKVAGPCPISPFALTTF
jgi:hypothetical protein